MNRYKILLVQSVFGLTYRQNYKTVTVRAEFYDRAMTLAESENKGWTACDWKECK